MQLPKELLVYAMLLAGEDFYFETQCTDYEGFFFCSFIVDIWKKYKNQKSEKRIAHLEFLYLGDEVWMMFLGEAGMYCEGD